MALQIQLKKLAAFMPDVELRDAFYFGGVAMIWYGLQQVSPPAAWALCGGIFLWTGVRR